MAGTPRVAKPGPRDFIRPPFTPDAQQVEWVKAMLEAPHVSLVTGRRRGKTTTLKALMWEEGGRKERLYEFAYGAPTYKLAGDVYDEVCRDFKPMITRKRDSDHIINFRPWGRNPAGAVLRFWSMEQHDNLRGVGLDRAVLDEFCDIEEQAWFGTIRPMLMGRKGKAAFTGTPKRVGIGFTWARQMFYRGQDPESKRYRSFSGSGLDNPRLSEQERKDIIEDYEGRPDEFKEEILAEWLDDEGAVFEKLGIAFTLPYRQDGLWCWRGQEPVRGVRYLIGFDIASHEDYNIFSVWRMDTGQQVELWRIRGEEYDSVLALLHGVRERFNKATVYADGNGMGAPIVQRLAKAYGSGAVDRKWASNALKTNDVTAARMLFQRESWQFMAVPWQLQEFRLYTRTKTQNGLWKYHAPEGSDDHDDSVAAACMVSERIKNREYAPEQAETLQSLEVRPDGQILVRESFWQEQEKVRKRKRRLWPWNQGGG